MAQLPFSVVIRERILRQADVPRRGVRNLLKAVDEAERRFDQLPADEINKVTALQTSIMYDRHHGINANRAVEQLSNDKFAEILQRQREVRAARQKLPEPVRRALGWT